MVCSQALKRLVQEIEEHHPKTHTHTTQTLSPMPHYPLLGAFRVATPWQCQMPPQQGGRDCRLNPCSSAGASLTASHQTPRSLNTQCGS